MSRAKTNNMIKRIVDAAMTVLLLCLMAYQVTGEMAHEWIGMGMTALVIVHQILNRKWYGALFKGKYNPYRSVTTILNILLLACFALTAFCGMSMSGYAVPFLYGMAPVSFVRRMHLSMSHWAFVLMGLHLGMHIPAITAALKLKDTDGVLVMPRDERYVGWAAIYREHVKIWHFDERKRVTNKEEQEGSNNGSAGGI